MHDYSKHSFSIFHNRICHFPLFISCATLAQGFNKRSKFADLMRSCYAAFNARVLLKEICMLITKNAAHKKENGNTCTVWEYDFQQQDVGFSYAHINGRYPTEGKVVNTACDLIYFVMSGECYIHVDGQDVHLKPQDAFFLKRGQEYFVVGNKVSIALVELPRWTVEQFKRLTSIQCLE